MRIWLHDENASLCKCYSHLIDAVHNFCGKHKCGMDEWDFAHDTSTIVFSI